MSLYMISQERPIVIVKVLSTGFYVYELERSMSH